MINYTKFQKEIVSELLNNGRVRYDVLPSGQYLVTTNGYNAVVLNPSQIVFSLERCIKTDIAKVCEMTEGDVELEKTDEFVRKSSISINRWTASDFDIWINSKFEQIFGQDVKMYASSSVGTVKVTSADGDILGVICPVRRG